MVVFTKEQNDYIKYVKKHDTKLIACAGSGKTRCIIERIKNLINQGVYDINQIRVLTFSRFTRDDFMQKINKYGDKLKLDECITTIDSFANTVVGSNNFIDVSLLSYSLLKYLEEGKDLKSNEKLANIKSVFVDEAQDIDQIQFNIIKAMKKKLKVSINLVGDPNQNIFQFRDSSDKYLVEYKAKEFKLTKNFRSYPPVVKFSSYLRPYSDKNIECNKTRDIYKPVFVQTRNEVDLEESLMSLINLLKKKTDLSNVAILSPTRGIMKGCGESYGLCLATNILHKNGILFKQFYQESGSNYGNGIKYKPRKGRINLLTYMGSKGLEWEYTILLDADYCLINKMEFTEEKHNQDRYLLYVACSRAIKNLFIYCHYKNNKQQLNPWFAKIPEKFYDTKEIFGKFEIHQQNYYKSRYTTLSKPYISQDKLYNIFNNFISKINIKKERIVNDESLEDIKINAFTDRYLKLLYKSMLGENKVKYPELDTLSTTVSIIDDAPNFVRRWFFYNKKRIDWNKFDDEVSKSKISSRIAEFIDNNFNRDIALSNNIISTGSYYSNYIINNREWIKKKYEGYLKATDSGSIIKGTFYTTLIKYALDTNHYYHITTKGKSYKPILRNIEAAADSILSFVEKLSIKPKGFDIEVQTDAGKEYIDIIDVDNQPYFIELDTSFSVKSIIRGIQLVLSNSYKNGPVKLNFIHPLTFTVSRIVIDNPLEIIDVATR